MHGTRIQVVPALKKGKEYPATDGFLTAEKGQALGIYTADCVPIFLSAPSQGVVGLLHAGWRGVRAGILPKAYALMQRRWRCPRRNVHVWLGPSIGSCCYEVKWDVARFFRHSRRRKGSCWTVDLSQEIAVQARRLGLRFQGPLPVCTLHPRKHHSFRRDQTEERQISIIMRQA